MVSIWEARWLDRVWAILEQFRARPPLNDVHESAPMLVVYFTRCGFSGDVLLRELIIFEIGSNFLSRRVIHRRFPEVAKGPVTASASRALTGLSRFKGGIRAIQISPWVPNMSCAARCFWRRPPARCKICRFVAYSSGSSDGLNERLTHESAAKWHLAADACTPRRCTLTNNSSALTISPANT